ncbi:MAG: indole-3-glycerol phosphate synthase TrpC [Planctomycetota bacterium]|jgi:serine O-acetyltransferase
MFENVRADFRAIKQRDPAAHGFFERLLCYSGFQGLVLHRVAHWIHTKLRLRLVARLLSQVSRLFTGVEIHPGATIAGGCFIDHGMGVVIGETSIIERNVTLFQGVTLGGTGEATGKRHPTLQEGVVVGAGACVLGNITIGRYSRIGARSVAVLDVPPESTVVGVPGRIVTHQGTRVHGATLDHGNLPDPIKNALQELHEEIKLAEAEIHRHYNFLADMRECKLREVGHAEHRVSLEELKPRAEEKRAGRRSFRDALAADGMSLIAECKRASPSAGVIVPHYYPEEISASYERGGARALSVLTDRCHFHGGLEDINTVRGATKLPVLRKDFLLSPYHIYQSAAAGADCVLLIVRFLQGEELAEFYSLAKELGLDALVEIHNEAELERALEADAEIIGINNRNLELLTTDLAVTGTIRPKVPAGKLVVSESGIRTREDVKRLEDMGVDAILVGEHLLKQGDREKSCRELLG